MSLHRLSHIEVGVPAGVLDATRAFYREFGLAELAPGRFATRDGGEQLALAAAPRRALLALAVGVDDTDDLGRAAAALAEGQTSGLLASGGVDAEAPLAGSLAAV